jgi:hypothetical protein
MKYETMELTLTFYNRASNLTVEVPEVESEDGSVITPLTVSWPEGSCKSHLLLIRDENKCEE